MCRKRKGKREKKENTNLYAIHLNDFDRNHKNCTAFMFLLMFLQWIFNYIFRKLKLPEKNNFELRNV